MNFEKPVIAVTALGDTGIEVYNITANSDFEDIELIRIVNYYAMILGINETEGMLYGPLPVAYHVEYLMFIYTHKITNPHISDPRALKEKQMVPASIIIFFNTTIDGLASKCRKDITSYMSKWLKQFSTVDDIDSRQLKELQEHIYQMFEKEANEIKPQKTETNTVVVSKNIQVLKTIAENNNKKFSILLVNIPEHLTLMLKKSFLVYNFDIIEYFEDDGKTVYVKIPNVSFKLIRFSSNPQSFSKEFNKSLHGTFVFSDFESTKTDTNSIALIQQALYRTGNQTHISLVISGIKSVSELSEIGVTSLLQNAIGKSISLINLSEEGKNIELAILDFFDKVAEKISQSLRDL